MEKDAHTGHPPRAQLAALLRLYGELGIASLMQDGPRDRFAETARETRTRKAPSSHGAADGAREQPPAAAAPASREPAPSAAPPPPPPPAATLLPLGDAEAAAEARERARSAGSLAELEATLAQFTGCALRATAKSTVFGNGPETAALMLIGEAPGREEDLAGEPFVGRSGQLLNRMLAAIGLAREAVRVTNTVPWRPPGNRSPTPAEAEICLPFVLRQVELVQPRVLVCLGSPSAKAILRSDEGILRLRGRWSEFRSPGLEVPIPVTAILHPAYLLRQPGQKRLAWRDLLSVKSRLDS